MTEGKLLQRDFYHRLGEQSDRRLDEVDARAKQRMTDGNMSMTEIVRAQGVEGREAVRPYFEAAMRPADRAIRAIDSGHVRQATDDDRGR